MHATKQKMMKWDRLKNRSDFLRVQAAGNKWVSKGVIVQAAENSGEKSHFGITVTKRLNKSAVVRNRIKRRLRAAAYDVFPTCSKDRVDYVLIGRPETLTRSYESLCKDLAWCLKRMGHQREAGGCETAPETDGQK